MRIDELNTEKQNEIINGFRKKNFVNKKISQIFSNFSFLKFFFIFSFRIYIFIKSIKNNCSVLFFVCYRIIVGPFFCTGLNCYQNI